jgi:hypothetical protein
MSAAAMAIEKGQRSIRISDRADRKNVGAMIIVPKW